MKTYQDLTNIGESEESRMSFVGEVISEHTASDIYQTAKIADEYAKHQNRTITQYQKLLYTISGKAVPDNWSANYKIPSNFFNRFVTQECQYLLGNGVSWVNDSTADRLGNDFDVRLQDLGKKALIGGAGFGFYNLDHLEVFSVLEFAPLYDEENGALMAGVRWWQIDNTKPLRATLYEPDGYTDYIWIKGKGQVLKEKRSYKINVRYTEADGVEIYDGENYDTFPIVPLYANRNKQSELIGLRESIDAYDLIRSGACNDIDDASLIYWTINNAGGMDDIDLAEFVHRMKTVKAVALQDGQQAEAHTMETPYNAREAILDRLRRDMYRDAMALDTETIASGAVTATQILASYEPLNAKCDEFEYCVIDFVQGVLRIAGIEDNPTFTRSMIINRTEEITNLIQASEYLDSEYITGKILSVLGDADKAEEMLKKMADDEVDRARIQREAYEEAQQEEPQQEGEE